MSAHSERYRFDVVKLTVRCKSGPCPKSASDSSHEPLEYVESRSKNAKWPERAAAFDSDEFRNTGFRLSSDDQKCDPKSAPPSRPCEDFWMSKMAGTDNDDDMEKVIDKLAEALEGVTSTRVAFACGERATDRVELLVKAHGTVDAGQDELLSALLAQPCLRKWQTLLEGTDIRFKLSLRVDSDTTIEVMPEGGWGDENKPSEGNQNQSRSQEESYVEGKGEPEARKECEVKREVEIEDCEGECEGELDEIESATDSEGDEVNILDEPRGAESDTGDSGDESTTVV